MAFLTLKIIGAPLSLVESELTYRDTPPRNLHWQPNPSPPPHLPHHHTPSNKEQPHNASPPYNVLWRNKLINSRNPFDSLTPNNSTEGMHHQHHIVHFLDRAKNGDTYGQYV